MGHRVLVRLVSACNAHCHADNRFHGSIPTKRTASTPSMFRYNFEYGGAVASLGPLSFEDIIVVALISALMQQPLQALIQFAIGFAGATQFEWRYPFIAAELARRRELEEAISRVDVATLRRELAEDPFDELELHTKPDSALAVTASGSNAIHRTPHLPHQARAEAPTTTLTLDEAAQDYGWVEPPQCCIRYCYGVLWTCGRAPSQKEKWVAKRRKLDEQRNAAVRAHLDRLKAARRTKWATTVRRNRAATSVSPSTPVQKPPLWIDSDLLTAREYDELRRGVERRRRSRGCALCIASIPWIIAFAFNIAIRLILRRRARPGLTIGLHTRLTTRTSLARLPRVGEDMESLGDLEPSLRLRHRKAAMDDVPRYHATALLYSAAGADVGSADAGDVSVAQLYDAAARSNGPEDVERDLAARAVRCGPCCPAWTVSSIVVFAAVFVFLGWCLYYVLLWGLYEGQNVTRSFMQAWTLSQVINFLILEPAFILVGLALYLLVWPATAPYVVWAPGIGKLSAAAMEDSGAAGGGGANGAGAPLSGRLENLVLLRAAGYASSLTPGGSVLAFAQHPVMASAVGGDESAAVADAARRRRQRAAIDHGRGGGGALDDGERYELIVRRYMMYQLRAAELAAAKQRSTQQPMHSPSPSVSGPTSLVDRRAAVHWSDSDPGGPVETRRTVGHVAAGYNNGEDTVIAPSSPTARGNAAEPWPARSRGSVVAQQLPIRPGSATLFAGPSRRGAPKSTGADGRIATALPVTPITSAAPAALKIQRLAPVALPRHAAARGTSAMPTSPRGIASTVKVNRTRSASPVRARRGSVTKMAAHASSANRVAAPHGRPPRPGDALDA